MGGGRGRKGEKLKVNMFKIHFIEFPKNKIFLKHKTKNISDLSSFL